MVHTGNRLGDSEIKGNQHVPSSLFRLQLFSVWMFPRKLLLLIIDLLFKNKATVLAPAGSPISNTILIDACGGQSRGGIWYSDTPSPNTTIFSVLWPPSVALWGSLVLPYTLVVR